jgi:hypothetical protein
MNAGTYILSLRPNGITFQENLHHSCFKSNVFFFLNGLLKHIKVNEGNIDA